MPRRHKREPCELGVEVAIRVRALRQSLGMSSVQLAKASGLPPSQVMCIECAFHSPNTRTLRKLAAGLGVTVADLLNADIENDFCVIYETLRQKPDVVAKLKRNLCSENDSK
jgi:transcriptional regulator with XRE-family HTH domain